ncbi:MAG TPA: phenylalanine--tRNA ligase subunit alpha [Candidatus Krumholzibacteria bacterium]|jgi:phenylalanyl-tRNA synthetase alpha chain|nr:phenylalanine--tRNA ligase subunit alpha [Candidatus Krumholzibacteria bacterium]
MDPRAIESALGADVENAQNAQDLEAVRLRYLGRKGLITAYLHGIKDAEPAERPRIGAEANRLKLMCEALLDARAQVLGGGEGNEHYQPPVDGALPATPALAGRRHIIAQTFRRIRDVLEGMGYSLARGPEVELEYYNFQALNFPDEHPSRDLQDTFYVSREILLRTHTSPIQVRYMESHQPPLKIYAPGRVYRNEAIDASHQAEFHQVEGLYIDTEVSMADLRGDLLMFSRQLFGPDTNIRFKPHFFPFTEPSVDVDVTCFSCNGSGCALCGQSGWIEIMGAGMVHPNVLRTVGYDPDRYSGFAFGVGVDRIAMVRHGIPDIRLFLENDMRFLEQFQEPTS